MTIIMLIGFFTLLLAGVGYLMFSNAQQKRRDQRQRLLTALKARRNLFKELLSNFPSGFLPKELSVLLLRSLRDTAQQLSQLEPKNSLHEDDAKAYSTQLSQTTETAAHTRVRLTNIEQIKEARKMLQELFRFIDTQEKASQLSTLDARAHKDQIRRLALQITVDGFMISAKAATAAGKTRLAIHFYGLALKQLSGENAGRTFDKQITLLTNQIKKLEDTLSPTAQTIPEAQPRDWEQFEKANEKWKKKNLYDE